MKTGIITFHTANNYGAVLQCYALSESIKDLGHEVELIDLPLHEKPKNLRPLLRNKVLSMAFSSFRDTFLPKVVKPSVEKDVYVFGSDQVWNPQITKKHCLSFFGSWVKNNKPKIAYAASFGLATWDFPKLTLEVKKELSTFNALGIRESTGVSICKDQFDLDTTQVLDPTLLRTDYSSVFKERKTSKSLVCYIFGKDEQKMDQLRNIANRLELQAVLLNDARFRRDIKSVLFPSVAKWLSYIESSQFVITDSFHCMVFAIIFKKNFIAIPAIQARAGRMVSLLESLGLESRFFNTLEEAQNSDVILQDIDYSVVDKKLEDLRANSLEFLKDSLDNVK